MPRRITRKDTKRKRCSGPKNKTEEAFPRKMPEKDCVDTKEKGSPNSLKRKEKYLGSGAHKANKEVGERSAKTEESSLSQDI